MSAALHPPLPALDVVPPPAAAADQVAAIARANAEAVDREGRFPAEAVNAMRQTGLLGALVPRDLGGPGQTVPDMAKVCYEVGKACASSAMILAMHHIQLACLVQHAAGSPWHRRFMRQVVHEGLLLASVTSEHGVGGSMRTSRCAVQPIDDGFTLEKHATAISYGAHADALLITARAHPAADPSDQVLAVVPRAQADLRRTGGWDAMGMRGTCSEAFDVRCSGGNGQIIPVPFSAIAAATMVPVSHLLWSSLWAGIAADAVSRARAFLRAAMRDAPGRPPPGGARLVTAVERLQLVEARINSALHEYAAEPSDSFAGPATTNMLKTSVSETCLQVVQEALLICGFRGYSNVGRYSLSRHLRDLNSAQLMVSNDRIRDSTALLLLLQSPTLGVGGSAGQDD
jgi:acyl-CoA dehydrogenase